MNTLIILILFKFSIRCYGLQQDPNKYILSSNSLPEDLNFMPSLSNGHLGFTVYGDFIYVNGVYNGKGGDSRRARIPNIVNFSVKLSDPNQKNAIYEPFKRSYEMNLRKGYFESFEYYKDQNIMVSQKIYPHRFYNRAIVHDVHVLRKKNVTNELLVTLVPPVLKESTDFTFDRSNRVNYSVIHGVTKEKEHPFLQKSLNEIYVASIENISEEKSILINRNQKELYYNYVATIDLTEEDAVQELFYVLAVEAKQLSKKHSRLWKKFWSGFNIEVENNLEMNKILTSGIFYMASSLPSLNSFRPNHRYYGLSPTGLGRGSLDSDYQGHNFWDTEIWMFPVVLQMGITWARQLLEYRLYHLKGALYNANITSYKGARYPWESAFTGIEVVNPCCPEVAAQQIHISADIILAIEQYYSATNRQSWLCSKGWNMIHKITKFLESRVEWNETASTYHVKDVMGPDEDHQHVNDNVYTNYAFKKAFRFAQFAKGLCRKNIKKFRNWSEVADKMFIYYDSKLDYHPEYEGYTAETEIKQADAILLNYPLQMEMNRSTLLNDLRHYEKVVRSSGPAMTWSMFAINYMDAGDYEKADFYLLKNKDYIRPEFKVWSEVATNFNGSANFLTGVGGFLQAFIYGHLGIRYTHDGTKSIMTINGKPTSDLFKSLIFRGIKFANSVLDFTVQREKKTLELRKQGSVSLKLITSKGVSILKKGKIVILKQEKMRIETF